MFLLVAAIALVLIGVVTLIIGIFSDTLVWVFVSIGSTVLAGIVLYVLYRLGRRQVSIAVSGAETAVPAPAAPVTVGEPTVPVSTVPLPSAAAPVATPLPEPAGVAYEDAFEEEYAPVAVALDEGFPIAEYDELRVAEILPLLPELDADELAVVRSREVDTKGRETILARIDDLAASVAGAGQGAAGAAALPIAGYDELRVAEILPLLGQLDGDELEAVAEHEEHSANRQTVLNRIDALLESVDSRALAGEAGAAPPQPEAPAKKAPAKRAPAKSSPATKAPASKAPATKASAAKATAKTAKAAKATAAKATPAKAAPAKKAPAKTAAPARKAATKAAPAKKAAPATKAPATKAPATKAPARKAPATKAPARKVTATKAPARKVTARKAGGAVKK